jgi:hypothetical protein
MERRQRIKQANAELNEMFSGKPDSRINYTTVLVPEQYEAYLYHIKIWIGLVYKNYVGWHLGHNETEPYEFSSEDDELANDWAKAPKIEYAIVDYGTAYEMAYKETEWLNGVDDGNGAAKSKEWYNKHNGGGKYHVSHADERRVNALEKKVNETWNLETKSFYENPAFEHGFSDCEQIDAMLDPARPGFIQCREMVFDPKYVDRYREDFNKDPNPDLWEPLILLMPKFLCELPYVVSGNQSGRGNVLSNRGIGMNDIRIPYSEHSPLRKEGDDTELVRFGNRFNKRPEKLKKSQEIEEAVRWGKMHLKKYGIKKKITVIDPDTKKKSEVEEYDAYHASITKELKKLNWSTKERGKICLELQTEMENEVYNDDNIIGWDDKTLKLDPNRKQLYKEKSDEYLKENGGDYDWTCKMSIYAGYHKVQEVAERNNFGTRGRVDFYFKNRKAEKEYMKNITTHEISCVNRWNKWDEEFFKPKYDIDVSYLPVTKNQNKVAGWFNKPKQAPVLKKKKKVLKTKKKVLKTKKAA